MGWGDSRELIGAALRFFQISGFLPSLRRNILLPVRQHQFRINLVGAADWWNSSSTPALHDAVVTNRHHDPLIY
jgi:hypothetical protein